MPRRQHNRSGVPTYNAEFASLNSFGLETSNLGELSLSNDISFSPIGHASYDQFQRYQSTGAQGYAEYGQPLQAPYSQLHDPVLPPSARGSQVGPYWSSHASLEEEPAPLPSPPLLSANSLNFPPLYSTAAEQASLSVLSSNAPYGFPPPPGIPYAESAASAASAASSNLSPLEDESPNCGPLDEDKRRRNLAASARFRQKKKIREQQLESQTKELSDRAAELEQRIADLEQENKFLKALLTEKETDMTDTQRRKFEEFAVLVERGEL